jgi:hypothetical protein
MKKSTKIKNIVKYFFLIVFFLTFQYKNSIFMHVKTKIKSDENDKCFPLRNKVFNSNESNI